MEKPESAEIAHVNDISGIHSSTKTSIRERPDQHKQHVSSAKPLDVGQQRLPYSQIHDIGEEFRGVLMGDQVCGSRAALLDVWTGRRYVVPSKSNRQQCSRTCFGELLLFDVDR